MFAEGAGCRVVWIADVLPHEAAKAIEQVMEQGVAAIREALEPRVPA